MASIRPRTTAAGARSWQVRWWTLDGQQRSKTFSSQRAAKAYAAERDREQATGADRLDPQASRVTLGWLFDRWEQSRRPALRAKTWESYSGHWRLRIEPVLAKFELRHINREAVESWAAGLIIGPSGARTSHLVLRSLLGFAVRDGHLRVNPALSVQLPSIPPRERHRYLTVIEVARLADFCGTQGDVIILLAYTGLRWGELAGLRVGDVDLASRRLHVRQAVTFAHGRALIGPPKSRAGVRTVPLSSVAIAALKARVDGRENDQFAVAAPAGTVLNPTNWRRAVSWSSAIGSAKVAPLRPHDLRHTFASLCRSAGADLRLLQAVMGHSSIVVTANTYADLYDDELDAVAAALDTLG